MCVCCPDWRQKWVRTVCSVVNQVGTLNKIRDTKFGAGPIEDIKIVDDEARRVTRMRRRHHRRRRSNDRRTLFGYVTRTIETSGNKNTWSTLFLNILFSGYYLTIPLFIIIMFSFGSLSTHRRRRILCLHINYIRRLYTYQLYYKGPIMHIRLLPHLLPTYYNTIQVILYTLLL